MGDAESASLDADAHIPGRSHGETCIAKAAATQQRVLCIPLPCGAFVTVHFSTVLGKGSYGIVYAGSVDRSTCRHTSEGAGIIRGLHSELAGPPKAAAAESCSKSSAKPPQACQYCFSHRTRQVAVKALRHSSEKQQQFSLHRFKVLQLIRLHQLLAGRQEEPADAEGKRIRAPLSSISVDGNEAAASASSQKTNISSGSSSLSPSPIKDTEKTAAIVAAAADAANGLLIATATPVFEAHENGPCSCCSFLPFPRFTSLHLLQVFGVYACSRVPRNYLVMEKLSGPTLFGYLCSKYAHVLPKEWEACQIVMPILKGLCCIHEAGLIHGDIKLENIMFRFGVPHPSTLTLVDLDGLTPLPQAAARAAEAYSVAAAAIVEQQGTAQRLRVGKTHSVSGPMGEWTSASLEAVTVTTASDEAFGVSHPLLSSLLTGEASSLEGLCCTPQYLPLEVVREKKLSLFADLHAVGCICYLLMEGCFPHERVNLNCEGILSSGQLCQKLSRDVRYPRIKQQYSPVCEDFMRKLLSSDSKYRFLTAAEVLQHPWISFAQGLQTPQELQEEKQLLRSVLAAAGAAAEQAFKTAKKAEESILKQLGAEAYCHAEGGLEAMEDGLQLLLTPKAGSLREHGEGFLVNSHKVAYRGARWQLGVSAELKPAPAAVSDGCGNFCQFTADAQKLPKVVEGAAEAWLPCWRCGRSCGLRQLNSRLLSLCADGSATESIR
ncbi:CMGC MAPK mek kinase-related protein (incomplete catalytic triad) [Cyclospora cayetanensis]|uniref:CMGC MAPK mek kinase-related protein (Incomplete catalytic triad) n=1 Tax=Cyclospora cayetanensis TaxID=88456 RepID=A0A1D3D1P1_9EIME|nr:CMGC MAPK mek kinase-related protein (incomplete catalytic triad) [Cyclospora cayetanensis]